jgi:hypothetical protein
MAKDMGLGDGERREGIDSQARPIVHQSERGAQTSDSGGYQDDGGNVAEEYCCIAVVDPG